MWTITFATFGLWLGVSGWLIYILLTSGAVFAPLFTLVVFNFIMLPLILFCEGYAPQRLEVGESQIVILRRYRSVVISREEIRSIERLPDNALRWAVRTGGVGGLFGFYGSYYSRKIGAFTLYATGSDNLFLIRKWNGKNIVISCSEPDKMERFCEVA